MSEAPTQPRPWWVRLAVKRAWKRRSALFQLKFMGLFLLLFLYITLSGNIVLGLAGMAIEVFITLWLWLAVRWVDRNGQWP
jgi:hypothetical protein